jgi:hypothetical protein
MSWFWKLGEGVFVVQIRHGLGMGSRLVGELVELPATGAIAKPGQPDLPWGKKGLVRIIRVFSGKECRELPGIYKYHRMVNHSIKSRDKRYRFSGNRWCQNGVHNQVAEGYNNRLKTAFRTYGYFRPENAGMYLSEFSLMANIRHYGLNER